MRKLIVIVAAAITLSGCEQIKSLIGDNGEAARKAAAKERLCNGLALRMTNAESTLDRLRAIDSGAVTNGISMATGEYQRGENNAFGRGSAFYASCAALNAFGSQQDRENCDKVIRQAYETEKTLQGLRRSMSNAQCN